MIRLQKKIKSKKHLLVSFDSWALKVKIKGNVNIDVIILRIFRCLKIVRREADNRPDNTK